MIAPPLHVTSTFISLLSASSGISPTDNTEHRTPSTPPDIPDTEHTPRHTGHRAHPPTYRTPDPSCSDVRLRPVMAGDERAEVEVSGLTDDVDDYFLQLYFENRRSGGGPIQSITRNGPLALITFSDPGDAARVVSKEEHRLHQVTVQVRHPPPWDRTKVALCGLDPDTADDLLELYVEAVSGRDHVIIVRSADKTNALLSFHQELTEQDFRHLLTRLEEKKLQHRSILARRVRASADILVENIQPPILVELLEMYFESKRSGGGTVRSVTTLREDAAVVSFCDWNVVDRVLSKQHNLQNRPLSVSRYSPDLLGSPSNDIAQEREMEEEEPTKTPDMQQNDSRTDPGVTAEGSQEPSIAEKDEMVEVGFYDAVEEIEDDAQCGGSDVSRTRPETSQSRPHIQADRRDELGAPSTPRSPDADIGGHLLDTLGSSLPWGDDGVGVTTGGTPSSVQEAEVVMEAAELLFMQKYHHDLLAGMDAVTIFPLEEDEKFGFKVVGDTFSCKTAVEVLQHVVSSLLSHTITLDYPWVSHVLLESEGQRTLRDIEEQHHCVIDTSHISWKVLDCLYTDPWSFIYDTAATETSPVQSMITDEAPDNPLLHADMEGIKMFASLLNNEEEPNNVPSGEGLTTDVGNIHGEDLGVDLDTNTSLNENDPTTAEVKDEELDQVCQMSRKEFQDRQLDEEAQLLLAIQRSMDTQGVSIQEEEEELQKALAMSLLQQQSDDAEESLQRALEMSLQDQRAHGYSEPMRMLEDPTSFNETEAQSDSAQIRVLAGDETSIVVASVALRKAITSKLNTVSLEGTDGVQNIAQILAALEKKHKVKITKYGRELQIQGFLHGPSQCRQEMSEILNVLQARGQAKAEDMNLDVEMTDMPDTSEEYQRVVQHFRKTLQDQSIEVIQVQKVHNPLLYNQYQMKKLRTVMTDPNMPAERVLYHGTTDTSAKEICHNGFNRSFSGRNATFYGQGVYFALESEVSTRDTYSPPNKEGKKFVFVARVLTGEYTQGKENMRTPPIIPNATGEVPRRYDSLVNSMKDPSFFVIFNDTQAYPEYLITCRKHRHTTAK